MYSINVYDGRVISATQEVLANPIYRTITEEVALAIENGKVSAKDVVNAILDKSDKNALQKMIDLKATNVRPGAITGKETAQDKTDSSSNPEDPLSLSDLGLKKVSELSQLKKEEQPKPQQKPSAESAFTGSVQEEAKPLPTSVPPATGAAPDFAKTPTNALRVMAKEAGFDNWEKADRKTVIEFLSSPSATANAAQE